MDAIISSPLPNSRAARPTRGISPPMPRIPAPGPSNRFRAEGVADFRHRARLSDGVIAVVKQKLNIGPSIVTRRSPRGITRLGRLDPRAKDFGHAPGLG